MTSVSWEALAQWTGSSALPFPSETLEQFLWSADLVNVSQSADQLIIKRALLNCASAPSLNSRGLQCRVFQLLNDLNFDPTADDATLLFGSVFQSMIKNWLPHADVLGVALTVLNSVARKASFGLQLDYPFFLTALSKILQQYLWNITIQKNSLELALSALSACPKDEIGDADVLVEPLLNCIEINSSPESIEILRIYVQAAKQSSSEVPKRDKIVSVLNGVLEASPPPETKSSLAFVLDGLKLPVSASKVKRVTIDESATSSTPPTGALRSIRGGSGRKATPAVQQAAQQSLPLPTPPPSPSPTSTPAPPTPVAPPPRTPVVKPRAAASPTTTKTATTATPVQSAKIQQQISPIPQKSSPGSTPKQKQQPQQQQDPKQKQHPASASPRVSPAINAKPVLSLKAQGRVIDRKSPRAGSPSPSSPPSPLSLPLPSPLPSPSPRFKVNPKHLVDITRLSQQQAVAAINRAELIQTLFLDAAKKMESLLLENSTLRASLEQAEKRCEGRDAADGSEHRPKKGTDTAITSGGGGGSTSSWGEKSRNLAVEGLTAALQRIKSSRVRTEAKALPTRERFITSVTVETMERCATGLCSLFARQVPTASGSISISALRKCVSVLGLTPCSRGPATLQKSSLDLIISSSSMAMRRGHIQSQVTLDQMSFILLCCVGEAKKLQSAPGQQLVETLFKALSTSAAPAALENRGSLQDLAKDDEMLRLLLSSATVRLVYSKYLRGATVQSSPSSLISPYKGNPSAATDGLLPLEAIVTLCRDAKICPNFVSFSCVESLSWEVIRKFSANSAPVLTPRQFALFLVKLSARMPQFRQDDESSTGEAERRTRSLEQVLASCRL